MGCVGEYYAVNLLLGGFREVERNSVEKHYISRRGKGSVLFVANIDCEKSDKNVFYD